MPDEPGPIRRQLLQCEAAVADHDPDMSHPDGFSGTPFGDLHLVDQVNRTHNGICLESRADSEFGCRWGADGGGIPHPLHMGVDVGEIRPHGDASRIDCHRRPDIDHSKASRGRGAPIVVRVGSLGDDTAPVPSVLLPLSLIVGEAWASPGALDHFVTLAYLVVVGTVALFGLYLYVQGRWTASRASYQFVMIPFVAALAAAWVLDESIGGGLIIGGAIVLAGVYVGALSGKKAPVPTDPEHEVLAIRCSTV